MMDMPKTYLVSDLASELNVPRTTINDWLRIYGDYLESEVRGKRKVYPERTLGILREIKAMREAGNAQNMIEQFLADRYGIRPEPVAGPETDAPAAAPSPAPEGTPRPASPEDPPSAALVRQDPEIREFFQRMLEQENARRDSARRTARNMFLLVLALLTALVAAVLGIAYSFHEKMRESEAIAAWRQHSADQAVRAAAESLAELRKMQASSQALADEQAKRLEQLSVTLVRTRQDYQQETARLVREMRDQKEAADRALAEMRKTEEGRREAELAELKRAFAAGQNALLRQIEEAKTARDQAENRREQAENALAELRRQVIQTQISAPKAETPAVPEMKTEPETKGGSAL